MSKLSETIFHSRFISAFPGDAGDNPLRPRQTPGVLWAPATPTPVSAPALVHWNENLAAELALDAPVAEDVRILTGNALAPTMQPYAACYGGHQFGNWAGQLGDGRAIVLGEMQGATTDWPVAEIQLKGAGMTPYSRRADGRAVLRSSVREYLMSEAMHRLGVPTTRALSLCATGDPVLRDMFYDGRAAYEPGAVVSRVAPSLLRFGSFELPASRGELDNLRRLVDWTINHYYPHLAGEDRILAWFAEVLDRTALLMAHWMRVGFVHGVMNTDNMSILGLTIDYGPYSFLDAYDPQFTPNTTDLPGRRYAYGRQPAIGHWNLSCLAGAIAALLPDTQPLQAVLDTYPDRFAHHHFGMLCAKLGLDGYQPEDAPLLQALEQTLESLQPDFTLFYQQITHRVDSPELLTAEDFRQTFYRQPEEEGITQLNSLLDMLRARWARNAISPEAAKAKAVAANPRFILRNYLLHQAIEDLEQRQDDQLLRKLWAALNDPYGRTGDEFSGLRPDWAAQRAGCSMLSCSS